MKNCKSISNKVYFAAANGYSGFRSYFDTVFKSENYDKIFVLKGGPGTGKSSLLSSVLKHFYDAGCYTEAILCSSDTDSLDGAIIENKGRRVALLDGTAPHERDATIPGAIDKIINLGENWNEIELEKRKDEILLSKNKKQKSYKNAYNHLQISGIFALENSKIYNKHFDFQKAEKSSDLILKSLSLQSQLDRSIRLNEAFGKFGKEIIDTDFAGKSILSIGGQAENAYLFMSMLSKKMKERGIGFIEYPSALSEVRTTALETSELVIIINQDSYDICANDFAIPFSETEKETCKRLSESEAYFRKIASEYFAEASKHHFSLEEIYKSNMDFSLNDEIIENIILSAERFLL